MAGLWSTWSTDNFDSFRSLVPWSRLHRSSQAYRRSLQCRCWSVRHIYSPWSFDSADAGINIFIFEYPVYVWHAISLSISQCQDHIDVFGVVQEMRRERVWMVQTEQQYICIHQCILAVLQVFYSKTYKTAFHNPVWRFLCLGFRICWHKWRQRNNRLKWCCLCWPFVNGHDWWHSYQRDAW